MDPYIIIKQHPDIIKLFNMYYPGLNIEQLDGDLFNDVIQNFIGNTASNFNKLQATPTDKNWELANENIPEMLLQTKLIYLNGKINNIPIKILFDTGATTNCIFKSKIIEAGLEDLIDIKCKANIQGINSNKETWGQIWYTEIELELKSPNANSGYGMVGLNLQVVNDDNMDKNNNSFDMILGLNFMKSYKTNIDFATNTITLNNTIKIKFD